jgi:hypothetical protein
MVFRQFWSLTVDGSSYVLELDDKGTWRIINEETKEFLVYLEAVHKWYGKVNGKGIIIIWPTFRDIAEQFHQKAVEIKYGNDSNGE